jgi:hypothetical protein
MWSNSAESSSHWPAAYHHPPPYSIRLVIRSLPFVLHLPVQYLLAYDDNNFNPATHQRNDVSFDPIDGTLVLPKPRNCEITIVCSMAEMSKNDDDTEEDSRRWCLTK